MEIKIQQKLGGIDAILQKAAKLNPMIFSDDQSLVKAADITKHATTQIIEEKKQQKEHRNDLHGIFLKSLKSSGHQDSTKQILKKTKEEVKTLIRRREAAKMTAIKAIRQKRLEAESEMQFSGDKTFISFNQAAQ